MSRFLHIAIGAALATAGMFAIAAPASAACVTNVSRYDTLNVRTGPGTYYDVTYEIPAGYCGFRLTGDYQGSWGKIRHNGRWGWVHMKYVKQGGDDYGGTPGYNPRPHGGLSAYEFSSGSYCPKISRYDTLNVRSGPGARYPVVGHFNSEYCDISGTGRCEGVWCETSNHEFSGWVNTRYLRNSESGD